MADYCAVFGSAVVGGESKEFQTAEQIGKLLAEMDFNVLCGGFGGVMEAVCRGNSRAGGQPRGIGLKKFDQTPNPYLENYRGVNSLGKRLDYFDKKAGPVLGLAGGIGTLTEIMYFWDLKKSNLSTDHQIILFGKNWTNYLQTLEKNFIINKQYFQAIQVVNTSKKLRETLA
ncbi:MAG: LOG family protein [bacterium]